MNPITQVKYPLRRLQASVLGFGTMGRLHPSSNSLPSEQKSTGIGAAYELILDEAASLEVLSYATDPVSYFWTQLTDMDKVCVPTPET